MTDTINIYDTTGLQLVVPQSAITLNFGGNQIEYNHGTHVITVDYLFAELDSSTLTVTVTGSPVTSAVTTSGQTCGATSRIAWSTVSDNQELAIATPLSPGQQVDWEIEFEGPRPTIPLKVKIRRR